MHILIIHLTLASKRHIKAALGRHSACPLLLNTISWSCGSRLHSVCHSFLLFSGGSDQQRKQVGAVYLLSRIKKPGTLFFILIQYCLLSELSPRTEFFLFYTQSNVSTHILQVGKIFSFWVKYNMMGILWHQEQILPHQHGLLEQVSLAGGLIKRARIPCFHLFCFIMSRAQITSKQSGK